MWKERNERGIEGDPPCDECWVDPMPENQDAWKIFDINRYQLIPIGMDGHILDINHVPIHQAIEMYKIKNGQECFEKVLMLARWWIKKWNNKG